MKLPPLTRRTVWLAAPATQIGVLLLAVTAVALVPPGTGAWDGKTAVEVASGVAAVGIAAIAVVFGTYALRLRAVRNPEREAACLQPRGPRGWVPWYLQPRVDTANAARDGLAHAVGLLCLTPFVWLLTGRYGMAIAAGPSVVLGAGLVLSGKWALRRVWNSETGPRVMAESAARKVPLDRLPKGAHFDDGGRILLERAGAPTGSPTADVTKRLLDEDVPVDTLLELVQLAATITSTSEAAAASAA